MGYDDAADLDRAWAAGFFDGEGCTSILSVQRDRNKYLRMSVSQKTPELLEKFQRIVGCGKIYAAKKREIHNWNCYVETDCDHVLETLWPYLGDVKKAQALEVISTVRKHREIQKMPPKSGRKGSNQFAAQSARV